MNNAELIKALRNCVTPMPGSCGKCPYQGVDCRWNLMIDAADAIEAADKRIAVLERILKAVQENSGINFRLWQEAETQLPKEGEWIIDGMNEYQLSYGCVGYEPIYRCSKCGITTESYLRTERPIMPEDADFPNYCPNCGARMQTVTDCHTLESDR